MMDKCLFTPPPLVMDCTSLERFALQRPLHVWMGMRVLSVSDADVAITVAWRPEFVSNPELMSTHGGILATLVDVAGSYAITARIARSAPTLELQINYQKMAKPGPLIVRGRVRDWGAKTAVSESFVYDEAGELISSGQATYFVGAPKS